MKYAISFFISFNLHASPITVHHEQTSTRAHSVKNIFVGTYHIPEDLISVKEVVKCDELIGQGKLDLCIKNNGDLLVVSVDRRFVNESLKIFQAP